MIQFSSGSYDWQHANRVADPVGSSIVLDNKSISGHGMSSLYYRQVSNISRTLVGDHSDVVGASPVGAAPTTSSFLT